MNDKSLMLSRIKEFYKFSTDSELADFLGIQRSTLSNWTKRNSIDYDLVFSKCEQMDKNYLLTGQSELLTETKYNTAISISLEETRPNEILLYDVSAAAGYTSFDEIISKEKVVGKFIVPIFQDISWMIYVRGSSMYPKYSSGDIVACRVLHESRFIQWGKVYVIATREQGILVKRLKKCDDDNCITAVSDNKMYDPFDIPKDEILGVALVVGVIRLE